MFNMSDLTQEYTRLVYVAVVSRTYTATPAGHKVIKAVIILLEEKLLVVSSLYWWSGMFLCVFTLLHMTGHDRTYLNTQWVDSFVMKLWGGFIMWLRKTRRPHTEYCLIWQPFDMQGLDLLGFFFNPGENLDGRNVASLNTWKLGNCIHLLPSCFWLLVKSHPWFVKKKNNKIKSWEEGKSVQFDISYVYLLVLIVVIDSLWAHHLQA